MRNFTYKDNSLYAEQVNVAEITEQFGTPCYIYSQAGIEQQAHAFQTAFGNFPHQLCYAVKANSNLSILKLLVDLGIGFDIVSGGELARVLQAGGNPQTIVFSGVGKQIDEIKQALTANILCFNIESESELIRLNAIAGSMNKQPGIAIRINPDIDVNTHPYIATGLKENKFGIALEKALDVYQLAAQLPHVKIIGLAYHLGSQITSVQPYLEAVDRLLDLVSELKKLNIEIQYLNVGGGLGIRYQDECPPTPDILVAALIEKLADTHLKLIMEPGRSLVAEAGILATKVEYIKPHGTRNFVIVDAGMNDLLRPALYGAWHDILPLQKNHRPLMLYDIVGPICESADFLAKNREFTTLHEGELLAIGCAGAYGFSMGSNYNSRPRPPEVLVNNNKFTLIRRKEEITDLFSGEIL